MEKYFGHVLFDNFVYSLSPHRWRFIDQTVNAKGKFA